MDIKGHTVHRVLIAPTADIAEEYYFSFLVDRAARQYLCIASTEGGVEIEVTAHENPDAVAKVGIDPLVGVDDAKAREIVAATGFPAEVADEAVEVIKKLWTVFVEEDASLVEVNPLVRLGNGHLDALDGKVTLDENADFRHPDHAAFEDKAAADPLEAEAKEKGLNYVKLDGEVGIIGNGAGLVMSTLDVVAYAGEAHGGVKPANFLDIGGGASAEVMANGLAHHLGRPAGEERLRQRLRRHHRVRRGRQRHRARAARSSATRPTSRSSSASTATTSRRAAASSTRPNHPLVTMVDTMDGAADRAAELAAKGKGLTMAIFLTENSKVIVQGMTGSEGSKHTQRMLDSGTNVVGGVTPGKGGQTRRLRRRDRPGLRLGGRGGRGHRRRRVRRVRAAEVHQGRGRRVRRRRHPAGRRDHRRRAGQGHRGVLRLRAVQGHDADHRPELPRPDQPRQVATPASSRPTSPRPDASGWCRSRAR